MMYIISVNTAEDYNIMEIMPWKYKTFIQFTYKQINHIALTPSIAPLMPKLTYALTLYIA